MNILIKLTSIVSLIIAPHIAVNKGHSGHDSHEGHNHGLNSPKKMEKVIEAPVKKVSLVKEFKK